MIVNKIKFPPFTGISCNMMPFIQGDSASLPALYQPYSSIINENFLEHGKIGFLTIDEKFVEAGASQRGYGNGDRNVHIEVGRPNNNWGGNSWGGNYKTLLDDNTQVLIANSLSQTCRTWNNVEKRYTLDGDLSAYINDYPENTGKLLEAGELVKLSIFSPHECIKQKESGNRQFFRIVGKGVKGREDYFTENPLVRV